MAPKTPPEQLAKIRARNNAWHAAVKRLIVANKGEWDALYAQEASVRGVTPRR